MQKIVLLTCYIFSPEDSRDSTFQTARTEKLTALPYYAEPLKTAVWLILALGLALLLSLLQ